MQSAPDALDASSQCHARRLLGSRAHALAGRRHSGEPRCTRPPAARSGRGVAERPERAPLAIHPAPRRQVPRRQRRVARGHRADSRRTASRLECARIGGCILDRSETAHAFLARRTCACRAISFSSAMTNGIPVGTGPFLVAEWQPGETAQARRERRQLGGSSFCGCGRNRIRQIAARPGHRARTGQDRPDRSRAAGGNCAAADTWRVVIVVSCRWNCWRWFSPRIQRRKTLACARRWRWRSIASRFSPCF